MYPAKGAIAPGSDADIVILDPGDSRTLTANQLHESDYTPWEGWTVECWPVMTMLRGQIAVQGGELKAEPGSGELVERRIEREILQSAAL
jgi:dihydropyrimidinase